MSSNWKFPVYTKKKKIDVFNIYSTDKTSSMYLVYKINISECK